MTFEAYGAPPFRRSYNRVSIRSNGYIGVSRDVLWKHLPRDCHRVQLYWKPATREIGVEFLNETAWKVMESKKPLSLALVKSRTGGGAINAERFFRTFEIEYRQFLGPRAYRMVPLRSLGIDRDGEMLVVQLEQAKSSSLDALT